MNVVFVAGHYFVPEWGERGICSCRCSMNNHDNDKCTFEFVGMWCNQIVCVACQLMMGGTSAALDALARELIEVVFDPEID